MTKMVVLLDNQWYRIMCVMRGQKESTVMLTQKQIDFYHEQGYLGVENVLPQEFVSELRRVTDEFVEQSRAHSEHTDVFDLEPGHTAAAPRLRRLKNPVQQHPVYDQALRHAAILEDRKSVVRERV